MKYPELQGRTAVITGASKGLGKAMALALAEEGVNVALVSRDAKLLNEVALEVQVRGAEAAVFKADICSESDVDQLRADVLARFKSIHILINNAGINIRKPVHEFTLAEWNSVLATNLTGVFLFTRAFVPHLIERKFGRIINMTSMMSHVSLPGRTAYSATKAGLLGFTRALALELAPHQITVNGISPGPFATDMNIPLMNNPEVNQQFVSKIPLGRWGKVEEIGQLACYLASDAGGFITGTDVVIDGGWTAQ